MFNDILSISVVLISKRTQKLLFLLIYGGEIWYFRLLIVDLHKSLLMLIFLKKIIVDVDRWGKKIVINILVDPPMYPPYNLVWGVEGCWRFYMVVQGKKLYKLVKFCTRLYKASNSCTRLYKAVHDCTMLYQIVQVFTTLNNQLQLFTRL